jgi:hypothetical protein
MKTTAFLTVLISIISAGCAITQKPASVVDVPSDVSMAVPSEPATPSVASAMPHKEAMPRTGQVADSSSKTLGLADLLPIAKRAAKSPMSAKSYAGQTLRGQAKFIKAPKGNPNAVVADVRVAGLGEVSLWCRNVLGAAPAGRVMTFEGTLTGSVYTSEDFSHDVTMKDCRFHE